MRGRTAVGLVGGVVLLLAGGFAFLAWAFGGLTGLLGFVVPFLVLLGLVTSGSALVARRVARGEQVDDRHERRGTSQGGTGSKKAPS